MCRVADVFSNCSNACDVYKIQSLHKTIACASLTKMAAELIHLKQSHFAQRHTDEMGLCSPEGGSGDGLF